MLASQPNPLTAAPQANHQPAGRPRAQTPPRATPRRPPTRTAAPRSALPPGRANADATARRRAPWDRTRIAWSSTPCRLLRRRRAPRHSQQPGGGLGYLDIAQQWSCMITSCTRRPLGRRRQEQLATRAHAHAHMTPPPNVAVPLRACGPAAQRVAAGERHVVSSPRRRTTDVPGTDVQRPTF